MRKTVLFLGFLSFLAWISLHAQLALAWPPTYGAEFEFTNDRLMEDWELSDAFSPNHDHEREAQIEFKQKMEQKCGLINCKIVEVPGKWDTPEFRVEYPDGWWFKITYDPACVEITTKPSTLEELGKIQPRIDADIFGTAKEISLFPDPETGAGHFNFGATSTFGDDAKSFLRFFVDYANHPELASGVLGRDPSNAPTLASLGKRHHKALRNVIQEVESGKIKTVAELAKRIQSKVYTRTAGFGEGIMKWLESFDATYHYQAVSVKQLNKAGFPEEDRPIELRAMYPQRDAKDFILMGELLEARVQQLNSAADPIVLRPLHARKYNETELVSRYYKYVAEAGLDWNKYKILMNPDLLSVEPDSFLTGKGKWDSPAFAKEVAPYFDDLETSTWIRERLFATFTDPSVLKSPDQAVALLEKQANRISRIRKELPGQAKAIEAFLNRVIQSDLWTQDSKLKALLTDRIAKVPSAVVAEKPRIGQKCVQIIKKALLGWESAHP